MGLVPASNPILRRTNVRPSLRAHAQKEFNIMRNNTFATAATATMAVLLSASAALAGPPVHSATGGGTVDWPGGRVTYGFTAQIDAAGVVIGQAEFVHRDAGITNHVVINCLTVVGNTAWLGGTITISSNPALVGLDVVWEVQDNGQGIAAPPDKVSNVQPGVAPGTCNSMPDLGLIDWTNGNVQVQ